MKIGLDEHKIIVISEDTEVAIESPKIFTQPSLTVIIGLVGICMLLIILSIILHLLFCYQTNPPTNTTRTERMRNTHISHDIQGVECHQQRDNIHWVFRDHSFSRKKTNFSSFKFPNSIEANFNSTILLTTIN